MAIEWSGLSPGLLVRLDRSAGQPLRAQLEASLREAIRGGRLRAGERLPSSRELAHALGVSRGMVQDCYGQLLAEGYLTSRTGSATRVADISGHPGRRPARGRPGHGLALAALARPPAPGTAADRGLPTRRTGPVQLPAYRLGLGHQAGVHPGRLRGPGIRRPARQPRTARGPRRLPAAGTSRRRQPRADDHQHRVRAGNQPGTARPGPPGRRDLRGLRRPRLRQRAGRRNSPRSPGDGHPRHLPAGRRARPRGRRTGGQRSPGCRGHPGTPVPHRGGPVPGPAARPDRLGPARRRVRDRGRLRLGVPLRQGTRRRAAGTSPRPGLPARHGQQGTGARGPPRLGPRPFATGRGGRRRESR